MLKWVNQFLSYNRLTRIHPRGRWPPVLYFWARERVFFRNFMNHQRILPLPTSINIYTISVWFVFCHCPQALHFTKSDQFPFRFRVSRIYWRRGWARPEFWRVQLRGKERVFIGPDRRFYTAHKPSFLFFTKMWFRFRVDVFYCGLPFSKLIFCVFNLTLLTGRRFRLFRFLDFVSGLMYFIGFQEIHFEF